MRYFQIDFVSQNFYFYWYLEISFIAICSPKLEQYSNSTNLILREVRNYYLNSLSLLMSYFFYLVVAKQNLLKLLFCL